MPHSRSEGAEERTWKLPFLRLQNQRRKALQYPLLVFTVVIFVYCATFESSQPQATVGGGDGGSKGSGGRNRTEDSEVTIWASMGLCYSSNAHIKGKDAYPYKEVAPLALLLWRHHLPRVRPIVRIVYSEPEVDAAMRRYGSVLERAGALVEWLPAGALDCVLMAQLVRMFAGDNPSVEEHHVVIVVDINLFVASEELIRPILDHPDKLVWNPLYDVTRRLTGGFQDFDGLYGTFCIDLMAMRARTWAEVTGYQGSLEELVRHFREEVKLVAASSVWYTDQLIITWSLLASRLCSVPASSGLWNMPGLAWSSEAGSEACWTGDETWAECTVYQEFEHFNCKYWHFYPEQNFREHLNIFYLLINDQVGLDSELVTGSWY